MKERDVFYRYGETRLITNVLKKFLTSKKEEICQFDNRLSTSPFCISEFPYTLLAEIVAESKTREIANIVSFKSGS